MVNRMPARIATRSISSLAVPEQTAIWAFRKAAAEGLDRAAGAFRRQFGAATGADLAVTVCALLEDLGNGVSGDVEIAALDAPTLSGLERALLSWVALAQRGTAVEFRIVASGLVEPWRMASAADGVRQMATILTQRGLDLPLADNPEPLPARRMAHSLTILPAAGAPEDLTVAERLLLQAVRYWVYRVKREEATFPRLEEEFANFGIAAAVAPLDGFMRLLASKARRTIDVRCFDCPGFSLDEAKILCAISSAQLVMDLDCEAALAGLLSEIAVDAGVRQAKHIASVLLATAHKLPIRRQDATDPFIADKTPAAGSRLH